MSRKYYYGTEDEEYYDETDYEDEADFLFALMDETTEDFVVMAEMTNSRRSGHTFCIANEEFIEYGEGVCGHICPHYEPRNKIKGICKHHSYGLIETGRKWKVFADGKIKKISGRNKKGINHEK